MLQDFRQFHIRLHAEWMKQNESLSFFPNKSVKLKVLSQIILHKSRYENNIRIYIYILLIRSVLHHWQHNTAAEMHHIYVLKWLWLSDFEQERVLRVCTYSGSSSDTETEPEGTGSTLGSPQRTLINRTKKNDAGLVEICTVTKWCFNFVTWKHRKHSFTITYFIKTVLHENLNRIWVALEAYFVKTLLRIIDCKSVWGKIFFIITNVFISSQSTRMKRPWREAAWRNPCPSWTTTNMICSRIWRRTAGGFPSTTCCTKSHRSMAKQETDSVWVLKQLVVYS